MEMTNMVVLWEWDPILHRQVAKQLGPAFKGAALKAKEPTLHRYIDLFVKRMKNIGRKAEGVSLPTWINWLCVDISADIAYNREMNALKDMKTPEYLGLLSGFNRALVVIQVSWRFPLLSPLKYPFLFTAMRPHSHIRDRSRQQIERRIRRKGSVMHLDFFEQMIPEDREPPKDRRQLRYLEQTAGQLLVAGYEPPALWFYFTIYFLLKNPKVLETLAGEIRGAFATYSYGKYLSYFIMLVCICSTYSSLSQPDILVDLLSVSYIRETKIIYKREWLQAAFSKLIRPKLRQLVFLMR
ncbi:cytochrome P450 [Daldinia bambusicola]|nr:cytochrome P450 [Daldinia bambusicola]